MPIQKCTPDPELLWVFSDSFSTLGPVDAIPFHGHSLRGATDKYTYIRIQKSVNCVRNGLQILRAQVLAAVHSWLVRTYACLIRAPDYRSNVLRIMNYVRAYTQERSITEENWARDRQPKSVRQTVRQTDRQTYFVHDRDFFDIGPWHSLSHSLLQTDQEEGVRTCGAAGAMLWSTISMPVDGITVRAWSYCHRMKMSLKVRPGKGWMFQFSSKRRLQNETGK